AINALLALAEAPRSRLTRTAYNVAAVSRAAAEIRDVALREVPHATITYAADENRQPIIDTWPADVDDSAARRDWGFNPAHDFNRAFSDSLFPPTRRRYRGQT